MAARGPFLGWYGPASWKGVLRGDLVTFFGFEHVETVRAFTKINGVVHVITDGGNTSSGNAGSQSNGGGSFRRVRPLSDADGFARVDYPGGAVRRTLDRLAMAHEASVPVTEIPAVVASPASSDAMLVTRLEASDHPSAVALRAAVKAVLNA